MGKPPPVKIHTLYKPLVPTPPHVAIETTQSRTHAAIYLQFFEVQYYYLMAKEI